jgi:hypothetical protein
MNDNLFGFVVSMFAALAGAVTATAAGVIALVLVVEGLRLLRDQTIGPALRRRALLRASERVALERARNLLGRSAPQEAVRRMAAAWCGARACHAALADDVADAQIWARASARLGPIQFGIDRDNDGTPVVVAVDRAGRVSHLEVGDTLEVARYGIQAALGRLNDLPDLLSEDRHLAQEWAEVPASPNWKDWGMPLTAV